MNYSTTQASNIASLVGILMLVLNHFKINIAAEDLTNMIGAAIVIGSNLINYYHRYQKGGLTLGGFRKY